MVKNEEIKTEFNMFSDIWKFFKESLPEQKMSDEEYWNKVVAAAKEISLKYKSAFCDDVINTILNELKRRSQRIS